MFEQKGEEFLYKSKVSPSMDYETIAVGVGAVSGVFFQGLLDSHVRPFLRVWRNSGIPLTKIDVNKARTLDIALSQWSALFPNPSEPRKTEALRESLPAAVREAFDRYIIKDGIRIYASAEDPVGSWITLFENRALLKKRVRDFYKEAPVQDYLTRTE